MCKCDIRETTYECQVVATFQAYDGLELARRDFQHQLVKSLQSVQQKLETFACHNFPLLSHLHYTLMTKIKVIMTLQR